MAQFREVAAAMLLPLAIFYPLAVLIMGTLLLNERNRQRLMRTSQVDHALLSSILGQAPAIVTRYRLSVHGLPAYEYVSEKAEEIAGVSAESLMANSIRRIDSIPREDAERLIAHIGHPDPAVAGSPIEHRIQVPGRPLRWVRRTAAATHDTQGTLWHAVTIDITAERLAELRRSELAQTIQVVDTPVFQFDPDLKITFCNAAVEAVYGYPPEELIGRPNSILRPPERTEAMVEFQRQLLANGGSGSIETEVLHKSGARVPVKLNVALLREPSGEVSGWTSIVHDLRAHKAQEAKLAQLAATDELTGAANRRAFLQAASSEIRRARRYGHPLALVAVDIDHFKRINDQYGHAGGDDALRQFVVALQPCLRQQIDLIGRMGGEEFAVLLPETDTAGAMIVAERMCSAVAKATVFHGSSAFPITASFGVAILAPNEDQVQPMLARADAALYQAKFDGRNRVAFAWSDTESTVAELTQRRSA